jgi:hypothetical protein
MKTSSGPDDNHVPDWLTARHDLRDGHERSRLRRADRSQHVLRHRPGCRGPYSGGSERELCLRVHGQVEHHWCWPLATSRQTQRR